MSHCCKHILLNLSTVAAELDMRFQGFNLGPRKRTAEDLEEPILFNSVHLCEAPGAFVTRLTLNKLLLGFLFSTYVPVSTMH